MQQRRYELIYGITAGASAQVTVVGAQIPFAYVIKRLAVHFVTGTQRTVQVRGFVSNENSAPTSIPPGNPIFSSYGNLQYLVAEGLTYVDLEFVVENPGTYIKLYANNTDSFLHNLDIIVSIERLDGV